MTTRAKTLGRLTDPQAVLAALDECRALGRSAFLARYGFGPSRDFLVLHPSTGERVDSKAAVGAAYGFQFPHEGPLRAAEFSGGEETVVRKLRSLGFEVVRIGEDWTEQEVDAAVADYFEMLRLEARQERYNKAEHNARLRRVLGGRSKGSVELKHQNISAVLNGLDLPFIPGYKPRGNSQLLLRKAVQRFVLEKADLLQDIVTAFEDMKPPAEATFNAVLVEAPPDIEVCSPEPEGLRLRLPRKVDFAARDEANRTLGRAGEHWTLGFEQQRLVEAGQPELFQAVDWVSERLGDGAGYDILSFDVAGQERFIEVKTTNGAKTTPSSSAATRWSSPGKPPSGSTCTGCSSSGSGRGSTS